MNSPHTLEPSGAQLAVELSLVENYFSCPSEFCLKKCVRYHEISETCEAIDEGDADMCPMLQSLIDDEVQKMADESSFT